MTMASAAVAVALLAACGGDDGDNDATNSTASQATETTNKAGGNEVTMRLIAFRPANLTVAPATTVTWRQTDAGSHTVTSGTVEQGGAGVTERPDGRFDSGELGTDETFEFTFAEPGTYQYFCSIHPATMRGEVQVNATNANAISPHTNH
jgi:plastocyanin